MEIIFEARKKHMLLSVIISNYNDAPYLEESLTAICDQSFSGMEVVFIDDASTDNSVEIARQILPRAHQHNIIVNDINSGVIANYNRVLSEIKGRYVYFASSNDRVNPGFLEQFTSHLERHPESGLCSGLATKMSESGRGLGFMHTALPLLDSGYVPPTEVLHKLTDRGNWIIGCSTIYRVEALRDVGGFDPNLYGSTDSVAAMRIAIRHGVSFIPRPVASWRISEEGYASLSVENWDTVKGIVEAGSRAFGGETGTNNFVKLWRREILFWHFQSAARRGNGKEAIERICHFEHLPDWFGSVLDLPLPIILQRFIGALMLSPRKFIQRVHIHVSWLGLKLRRTV